MSVFYEANNMMCWKEKNVKHRIWRFMTLFPTFMAISMGFSFHNSIAVLEGYFGKKSAFIRTPKFNLTTLKDKILQNRYLVQKITMKTWIEAFICLYFIFAIALAVYIEYYSFLLFHVLLMYGFGLNFYYSVRHLSFK